jgi:hypothetical protein
MRFSRTIAVSLLAFLPPGAVAIAQPGLPPPRRPRVEKRLEVQYTEAGKRLGEGSFDPAAETLLRAAETFTKVVFNLPDLSFQRAISYRDERGDHFLVEWGFQESHGNGSVILIDRPWLSLYLFRLPGYRIKAREHVGWLLADLFSNRYLPVKRHLEASPFETNEDAGSPNSFTWSFDPFRSGAPFYAGTVSVRGESAPEAWYLSVDVGKSLTNRYYPVKAFLAERFPPLIELVKNWDAGRIRGEMADRRKEDRMGERQQILLTELVQRGFTADQIVTFLDESPKGGELSHLDLLVRVLRKTKRQDLLVANFEPILEMYLRKGSPTASSAADTLLAEMGQACSPALEQHALRLLRAGTLFFGPLWYLRACSSSAEALEAIETPSTNPLHASEKAYAAQKIRSRMNTARPMPAAP